MPGTHSLSSCCEILASVWWEMESPARNAASAGDAACMLATCFSSLMLYVWLDMIGCIRFTSFGLSPATSSGNAAFTAPCGPTLARTSRTLVLSISHRTRDFVHWERLLDVRLVGEFISCARALVNHLLALSVVMPVRGQTATAEPHGPEISSQSPPSSPLLLVEPTPLPLWHCFSSTFL
jgi:hypothetical protein